MPCTVTSREAFARMDQRLYLNLVLNRRIRLAFPCPCFGWDRCGDSFTCYCSKGLANSSYPSDLPSLFLIKTKTQKNLYNKVSCTYCIRSPHSPRCTASRWAVRCNADHGVSSIGDSQCNLLALFFILTNAEIESPQFPILYNRLGGVWCQRLLLLLSWSIALANNFHQLCLPLCWVGQ